MALMVCMTFKLKLLGLVSSFLRKKYINKSKQKKAPGYPEPFKSINFCINYICANSTRRFITRPSSVELSAIGLVSPAPFTLMRLASTPEFTK